MTDEESNEVINRTTTIWFALLVIGRITSSSTSSVSTANLVWTGTQVAITSSSPEAQTVGELCSKINSSTALVAVLRMLVDVVSTICRNVCILLYKICWSGLRSRGTAVSKWILCLRFARCLESNITIFEFNSAKPFSLLMVDKLASRIGMISGINVVPTTVERTTDIEMLLLASIPTNFHCTSSGRGFVLLPVASSTYRETRFWNAAT